MIGHDLKHAWRTLLNRPAFTAIALLSLALGIGANSAIFSFVYSVLLAPLPYPDSERMVVLQETEKGREAGGSPERWKDWAAQSDVIAAVAAFYGESMTWKNAAETERLQAIRSYGDPLAVYGIQPVKGRNFTAEELTGKASASAVIVTNALWRERFGAGEVIGAALDLNGKPYTVVGVLPPTFEPRFQLIVPETTPIPRSARFLRQLARLQPGTSLQQAEAQLKVKAAALEKQYPDTDKGVGIGLVPLRDDITGPARVPLFVLLGAVGFVLLSACLNIASLLLYRATGRRREVAVRLALGASRWSIGRLLLAEGLLLGVAGGIMGLLLALWGVDALKVIAPEDMPRLAEVQLSWPVAAFAAALSLATSLICSLAPALQTSRLDLNDALKSGSRVVGRRHWMQSSLVIAEVGISLALLIGAGLLMRSFFNMQSRPLGFRSDELIAFSVPQGWQTPPAKLHAFTRAILDNVRNMPGVQAAEFTDRLPLEGGSSSLDVIAIAGQRVEPGPGTHIGQRMISPGYFSIMGVPLKAGRYLTDDDAQPDVRRAVINETMAQTLFAGDNPVGKTFRVRFSPKDPGRDFEVIGVAGNIPAEADSPKTGPAMYIHYAANFWPIGEFVVRGNLPRKQIYAAVKEAVRRVDSSQVVQGLRPLESVLDSAIAQPRLNAGMVAVFATLALLLAAMGIYGLLSNSVAERAQEIGIRMALGAPQASIVQLILKQAMPLLASGVAAGLAGALLLRDFLAKVLFDVQPTDVVSIGLATCLLIAVALTACFLPARRASRLDPVRVLRDE